MSKKTFQNLPAPKSPESEAIEQYVQAGPGRDQTSVNTEKQKSVKTDMVRLTVDMPRDLHRRYKASCSLREVKMNEEIRAFIETKVLSG